MSNFLQDHHSVQALAPAADRLAETVATDIIHMRDWRTITFNIQETVSTGRHTYTVEASDDAAGSHRQAVAFRYRECATGDTWGAWTECASTGFTSAAADLQIEVSVNSDELYSTYEWVRVVSVESVNDPVVASITAILTDPRYGMDAPPTAIV